MYQPKKLLTKNELNFFQCLKEAFPNLHIAVQVAMSAFIETDEFKDRVQFRSYYADFVLFDETAEPLLVIELDDSTHQTREKTIERDMRKNRVYTQAGMPLYRYPARFNYSAYEIKAIINPILIGEKAPPAYQIYSDFPPKKRNVTICADSPFERFGKLVKNIAGITTRFIKLIQNIITTAIKTILILILITIIIKAIVEVLNDGKNPPIQNPNQQRPAIQNPLFNPKNR